MLIDKRSITGQIEHWARIGKCAEENQDLTYSLIKEILIADARQLELGENFKLIYITGNAFQAFLQRQDQEELLYTVRRHLSPEGTFAFETRNPFGHDLDTYHEEVSWYSYTNLQGQIVNVSGTQSYDPIHQIMHWNTYRRWSHGRF